MSFLVTTTEIAQQLQKDRLNTFVFSPSWDNQPPERPPLLTFNGSRIGSEGNVVTIIAPPAAGKSSICEAIAASVLNPNTDTLGLETHLQPDEQLVYIDTERSKSDHYNAWLRCMNRAKISKVDEKSQQVIFFNIRGLARVTDDAPSAFTNGISRLTFLIRYAFGNPRAKMILLDGIADFVRDVNNPQECADLLYLITAYANELNRCIVVTIHDTASAQEKPRGHLGSELLRRSECVLIARRDVQTQQHCLTTDFQFGKVRSDSGGLEVHFEWNDEEKMFLSCEKRSSRKVRTNDDLQEIAQNVFSNKSTLSYSDLLVHISESTNTSINNAKKRFRQMSENGLIIKNDSGAWLLKK